MEISIKEGLIGGRKRQPGYEKRYSIDLNLEDRLILYIQREYLVKGVVTISNDYFFDETPIWPIVNGETYPHRRRIKVDHIYPDGEEPKIQDYYDKLDRLIEARDSGGNIGKTWGNFVRGLTPKLISEHDFNVLTSELQDSEPLEPLEDKSTIIRELRRLKGETKRVSVQSQRYQRNQQLVERLKQLYDYRCQLCSPDDPEVPPIPMKNGTKYVEVHHIQGFGETTSLSGQGEFNEQYTIDEADNAVVLCCYHHKMLHKHEAELIYDNQTKAFVSKNGEKNYR